jgi:nickel-dependent lactate racemase
VKIELDYGKEDLEIELPEGHWIEIIERRAVPALEDQEEAVRQALRGPIDSPPLRELVTAGDRVGIVVNDITRATPYPLLLPILLEELQDIPTYQISFFVATGTHRSNTRDELRGMLGEEIVEKYRIIQNDARDRDSHRLVGQTKGDHPIWIHGEFLDCTVRILTGFIEPHFFAGFSGGGKAVMPGLALLETVQNNHSVHNIDHPRATWGITKGNPLWEEIQEAAQMVGVTFLMNVTLNRKKEITGVFAGNLNSAHTQGCKFVRSGSMVGVKKPFDIVITSNSGYPLDLNLYQAVKGMSAAAQIVREGGSIIIATDCWDGIPEHGEYGKLLSESNSLDDLLARIRSPGFQCQDMWQAQIQALICKKADVYVYSKNLTEKQIRDALLQPCESIEKTVSRLIQRQGRKLNICVIPEGPQTIPYIK